MKTSIKTDYILLTLLVILALIFRYPYVPHEVGTDGFVHHILANTISDNGYAKWVLNPLSLFGLYPLSYPSGAYFVLSAISQCMNLDMTLTILISGLFLGMLGVFTSFLFGYEIKKSFLFAFLVAFAFSTSPYFINWTRWQMSGRILFVTLLPVVLCLILRFHTSGGAKKSRIGILIGILLIAMAALHRMFFLLLLVIFAYFLTLTITTLNKRFGFIQHIENRVSRSTVFFFLVILFLGAFLVQFSNIYIYEGIWRDYQTGIFFTGTSPIILALNAGTNYIGSIGILTFIGIFGLLLLLWKRNKTFNELFVIISVLLLTPLLALGLYISLFIIIFVSVLIAIGLEYLVKKNPSKENTQIKSLKRVNKNRSVLLMSLILISVLFSGYMIIHRTNLTTGVLDYTSWVPDSTYDAAMFLKTYGGNGSFYSNGGMTFLQIAALSEKRFFMDYEPEEIMYAIMTNISKEELNVKLINFSEISFGTNYLYKLSTSPTIRHLWWRGSKDSGSIEIITNYDIKYAVEDVRAKGCKIWSYGYATSPSNFFKSLPEESHLVYNNGMINIWYL